MSISHKVTNQVKETKTETDKQEAKCTASKYFVFFSIRVFVTDTDDSQDSRGREGTIFYSTLPFPSTHEHWDIYLQLCIWDDYHVFLIATLVFTRLPANVKKLLCYWVRLKTTDNILYRESEENLQLLLPSNLHKLIYEELDSKTG